MNDLWKFDGTSWTWVFGTVDGTANFGTKGVASPSNIPGGRYYATSFPAVSNSFWLFGGYGFANTTGSIFFFLISNIKAI